MLERQCSNDSARRAGQPPLVDEFLVAFIHSLIHSISKLVPHPQLLFALGFPVILN